MSNDDSLASGMYFCGDLLDRLQAIYPGKKWNVISETHGRSASFRGHLPRTFLVLFDYQKPGKARTVIGLRCSTAAYERARNKKQWLQRVARKVISATD